MQLNIHLPSTTQRFVVLGTSMALNFDAAISIRSNPLFRERLHSIVIYAPHAVETAEVLREIERFQKYLQQFNQSSDNLGKLSVSKERSHNSRASGSTSTHLTQFSSIALACGDGRIYRASGGTASDSLVLTASTDSFVVIAHAKLAAARDAATAAAQTKEHVESLLLALPLQGPSPGTVVTVCSNDVYPAVQAALSKVNLHPASGWRVYQVRVPYFGPSANMATAGTLSSLPGSCFPKFNDELLGPIENVCLGNALGVVKQLPLSASQVAGVVPIDIAVHNAILLLAMGEGHQLPSSLQSSASKGKHAEIAIATEARDALVWGMVGEYMIDYFGRYLPTVRNSNYIPAASDMIEPNPSIDFETQFNDLWNWGISLTAPMIWYRSFYANKFQKKHLTRFPHSTTAERMLSILNNIDATMEALQPTAAASSSASRLRLDDMMQSAQKTLLLKKGTNSGCNPEANAVGGGGSASTALPAEAHSSYLALLRMLERGGSSAQQFIPFVSLEWVAWEMYVKRVCVATLEYFVRHVFDHREVSPASFPPPSWSFHNALVFSGGDRAPSTNLLLRRVFPDLHWALRCGQQSNGSMVRLHAGGTPQRRLAILAQPHIQLLFNQLAREQNVTKEAIEQRAQSILVGIGDTMNHQQLRTFGYAIKKVFQTLYHRINLNTEAYERLFRAFRQPRCAVVVIPSHRSYVDFLVVSYLLVMMGFPVPHICSGEDFLRLGSLSDLLRGSGAFFMRRSFRSDKLYGALFKEYIRHLIRDRQCVEFFIEGMRSRTGKTIPPKLGILKFVTDAFFEKQDEIDDVLFVPVGLSYEKLLEGNVYADELMGIPKPKETVGNLLKSASILNSKYGALNVEVGEFISLRSFSDDPHQCPPGLERTPETERVPIRSSASSVSAGGGTYTPIRVLASIAWRVTYELQRNIVVTPTALLSAVMLCMFDPVALEKATVSSGIPAALVASNVEWLRSAVLHRHGKMNTNFAVCDGSQLMSYAIQLLQPRIWISPLSHVFLLGESLATTQMLFWVYSNQLLHVFADEAIVALCAFTFGKSRRAVAETDATAQVRHSDSVPPPHQQRPSNHLELNSNPDGASTLPTAETDVLISHCELRQKCQIVRVLLATEIPNNQRPCPYSADSWLSQALSNLYEDSRSIRRLPLLATESDDDNIEFSRNPFTSFILQLLYPYMESTWIVAVTISGLKELHQLVVAEPIIIQFAYDVAIGLHKRKFVPFIHSANRDTLKNSIQMLAEHNIVKAVSPGTYRLISPGSTSASPLTEEALAKHSSPIVRSQTNMAVPSNLVDMMNFVNQLRWRPIDTETMRDVSDAVKTILKTSLASKDPKSKM